MSRSMSETALPPKLYFRIGEVAELVGVEPHVLRYWEREFRSIRPTKSAKGQRVYSRRDVENLMRVRQLLYSEGFTIAGAKKKLQRAGVEADVETQMEAEAVAADGDGIQAATTDASKTRDQLVAMRREIEAFLGELGPSRRS
ncbi:MAG TPA: MerR family transcriptional regulator [Polyangiaceae bacterium]|nr:MerR family transcriptional regulator [Polyangiaceae bacterium]